MLVNKPLNTAYRISFCAQLGAYLNQDCKQAKIKALKLVVLPAVIGSTPAASHITR